MTKLYAVYIIKLTSDSVRNIGSESNDGKRYTTQILIKGKSRSDYINVR